MGSLSRFSPPRVTSVSVVAVLSLAGCAGSASSPPPRASASPPVSLATTASCAGLTRSQQFAAARVVLDGEMLPGPVASLSQGILSSPARVRVERYLKGHGPPVVTVQTAMTAASAGGVLVTEDGIRPRAGQRWRIYSSGTKEPYSTSTCLGSRRLPERTSRFSARGQLSFDYPATWHARSYAMPPAPFTGWLVWLSPQPMHPPCVTRRGTHNTTIRCGEPIKWLRPHSILVSWTNNSDPAGNFRLRRAVPISVGGRRGQWLVQAATTQQPQLGETEVVTVVVPIPRLRDSWYQLTAVIRGPGSAGLEAQVRSMLHTVRWR